MLVAEWTDGEAMYDRHGNTLDVKGLNRLRERIRVLSDDTEGEASLEDLAPGITWRFPDLPPFPRTTAAVDPLQLTFDELWPSSRRATAPCWTALARAELPHTRFHDLRHSAATFLLSQGFGLEDVKNLLGHSTIVLTSNTYGHVLEQRQQEMARGMDAVLGG